jgi:hypothetical protein
MAKTDVSWISDYSLMRVASWASAKRRDVRFTPDQWSAVISYTKEREMQNPTSTFAFSPRAMPLGPGVVLCAYLHESTPVVMGLISYIGGYPEPPSKTTIDEMCNVLVMSDTALHLREQAENAARQLLIPEGTEEWYHFVLSVMQYEMLKGATGE